MVKIGILRRGMISPDGHVRHVGDCGACLLRQLGFRAVLIQPGHGEPAIAWNRLRVIHRDEAIRVARISDDQDAHILGGVLCNRLALADENLAINPEQILSLHAGFARDTADKQCPVHIAESLVEIGRGDDVRQKWKRAIVQLHDHALQALEAGRDFDQMQRDRLVGAKHCARGNAKDECVTDLSGSAGDRDLNG